MNYDVIIGFSILAIAIIATVMYYKHLSNKETVSYFMGKMILPKRIKNIFRPDILAMYEQDRSIDTNSMISLFNGTVKRELKSKKLVSDLGSIGMFNITPLADQAADIELNLDLDRACNIVNTSAFEDRSENIRMLREINLRISKEYTTRTLTRLERTYILASLFKRKVFENSNPKRNPMLANRFLRQAKVLFTDQGKIAELEQIIMRASSDYTVNNFIENAHVFSDTLEAYPNENSKMLDYQLAVIFSNWL